MIFQGKGGDTGSEIILNRKFFHLLTLLIGVCHNARWIILMKFILTHLFEIFSKLFEM